MHALGPEFESGFCEHMRCKK